MRGHILGALAVGGGLVAMSGAAEASCFQKDFDSIFKHMATSSKSASGTICGQGFSITSPVSKDTRGAVANDKAITGKYNGVDVTLTAPSTLGASWTELFDMNGTHTIAATVNGRAVNLTERNVAHGDDTLKIEIAGSTLFEGTGAQFTTTAYLNILTALGIVDSGTVVREPVTRGQTQTTSAAVSSRISTVLTSVIASSFSSGGIMGGFGGSGSGGDKKDSDKTREKSSSLSGLAAGDALDRRFGTWITPSNTWLRNTNSLARYSGTLRNVLMGADYRFLPNAMAGVAVGYEGASIDTSFNDGKLDSAGFSVTPYVGAGFFDGRLTANLLAGYARSWADQSRMAGVKVKGSYTSQRWMLGSNVSGYLPVTNNLVFLPGLGLTAAWEHRDRFTESDGLDPVPSNDTVLVEGKVTAKVLYRVDKVDLTAGVSFIHDFVRDSDIGAAVGDAGRDEVSPEVGVTYNIADNQFVSIDGNLGLARKNMERGTIQATYRLNF